MYLFYFFVLIPFSHYPDMKSIYIFLLMLFGWQISLSQSFQKTEERTLATSDVIADAFCFLPVVGASKATLNLSVPFLKQHLLVSEDGHRYRIITQVNEAGELVTFGFEVSLKTKFNCQGKWFMPFENCIKQKTSGVLFSKTMESIYMECFLDRLNHCR